MGKHSSADDSTVDPLVAAALAQRAPGGAQHERPGRDGDVGWPGEPREGEGLGWPAEQEQPPAGGEGAQDRTAEAAPVTAGPLRGWRRLFGASPAA